MRLILFLLLTIPIAANDFYEATLEKAYIAFQEKEYKRAIEKLDLISTRIDNKDWRYFSIRAEVHEALRQEDEAIENYTFSIALNPTQPKVFKKLYELNIGIKRPTKSFDYLRLYLANNDQDIPMRYRALILAKRLGNEDYVRFALNKIQTSNTFVSEKNQILEKTTNLILNKKFKEARTECIKYLPFFPLNEVLHNNLQISQRNIDINGKDMESILIDSAVLLSDTPKYSLRLAFFYKEKKLYFPALNLFRRVFYTSLSQNGFELDPEIILYLKECYFKLNFTNDVRATLSLIEILNRIQKPEISEWDSLRINFNNNRELLISILYFTKQNKQLKAYAKYKEILNQRDERNADAEFMNIYSVFIYDDFRFKIE